VPKYRVLLVVIVETGYSICGSTSHSVCNFGQAVNHILSTSGHVYQVLSQILNLFPITLE